MNIKKIALGLCLALLLASTHGAHAAWPERPIHWIVPYPPGGGTDLVARVLAAQLEKTLGQPVVIDNRPGGSTVTGTAALASAEPDGYTVGMVFDSLAINSVLGVSTSYNPQTDFTPIIKLANVPLVFTVNTQQVPMKTLPELVTYSKAHPGWFTFGSLGPGSPHEIGFLWFKAMSKMDALVVPYKGIAPALQDVVAGQVKGMFVGVSVADGYIEQGTLHTLRGDQPAAVAQRAEQFHFCRAGLPGLRLRDVLRPCRAKRDAARNRRSAQYRDQSHFPDAGGACAIREDRHAGIGRYGRATGIRQVPGGEFRQVQKNHVADRRQIAMTRPFRRRAP